MNNPKYNYIYDKIPENISAEPWNNNEARLISFFSSGTLEIIKNHSEDYFILFASIFARKVFGQGYGKILNKLKVMGVLIPEEIGKSSAGKSLAYSKDDGIAASYRLNDECIANLKDKKYSKVIHKVPWVYNPRKMPGVVEIASESRNPLMSKLAENYCGVSFLDEWQTVKDIDYNAWVWGREYVKQVNKGQIKASNPENGRFYHPLICMSRLLRPYARANGEKLYAVDGKAFHPHLLATFLPESKRQEYLDYLRKIDIYSLFLPEYYEDYDDERDDVKRIYQIFLGDKDPRGKAIEIYSWYAANFPEIIEQKKRIQKSGGTVQMVLQRLESSIFIEKIFAKAGFWCLPMHDGLAVKSDDATEATIFCYKEINKCLGFPIRVTSKPFQLKKRERTPSTSPY